MPSARMWSLKCPSNTAMVSNAMEPQIRTFSDISASQESGKKYIQLASVGLQATQGAGKLHTHFAARRERPVAQIGRHPCIWRQVASHHHGAGGILEVENQCRPFLRAVVTVAHRDLEHQLRYFAIRRATGSQGRAGDGDRFDLAVVRHAAVKRLTRAFQKWPELGEG